MKSIYVVLIFFWLFVQPSPDGWNQFAKVKFTEKFFKEVNAYYLVPFLDSKIRSYEGKEIALEGYYLPYELDDRNTIIISRNPYASCFFCGGAGPESVAEVVFDARPPRFKPDQIVAVIGVLKLNDRNIDHMNFILEHARIKDRKPK
jgi:hypothetical protein